MTLDGTGYVDIPAGADLNDAKYRVPGAYACKANSVAKTLLNAPFDTAFIMKAFGATGDAYYIAQKAREYDFGTEKQRTLNNPDQSQPNWRETAQVESGICDKLRISTTTTEPTVIYNTKNSVYTRIGNQVTVQFEFDIASITGGSGIVALAGLPFALGNQTGVKSFFVNLINVKGVTIGFPMLYDNNSRGTNLIVCYDGETKRLAVENLQANTRLSGTIVYLI